MGKFGVSMFRSPLTVLSLSLTVFTLVACNNGPQPGAGPVVKPKANPAPEDSSENVQSGRRINAPGNRDFVAFEGYWYNKKWRRLILIEADGNATEFPHSARAAYIGVSKIDGKDKLLTEINCVGENSAEPACNIISNSGISSYSIVIHQDVEIDARGRLAVLESAIISQMGKPVAHFEKLTDAEGRKKIEELTQRPVN
jgi:hypothetical protein